MIVLTKLYVWLKQGFFSLLILLFLFLASSHDAHSQKRKKRKKTFHSYKKWRYGSGISKPGKVCKGIAKNRNKKPKKVKTSGKSNKKYKPQAEVDPQQTVAQKTTPTPKPPVKKDPEPVTPPEKPFEERSLDEKHEVEDEVLKENNLPEPTSEEHEKIRKNVQDHLKTKKDSEPLKLEPLYFVLDQDEFSVVDMEPFLVAVEYALQGKMVLIEGHTDHRGNAEYNKALSMKRVEKIRKLMLDMGVPDDRISVIGYGEEMANKSTQGEDEHQDSRRVDFTVF